MDLKNINVDEALMEAIIEGYKETCKKTIVWYMGMGRGTYSRPTVKSMVKTLNEHTEDLYSIIETLQTRDKTEESNDE